MNGVNGGYHRSGKGEGSGEETGGEDGGNRGRGADGNGVVFIKEEKDDFSEYQSCSKTGLSATNNLCNFIFDIYSLFLLVQWNSSIRATPFAELLWPLLRGGHF